MPDVWKFAQCDHDGNLLIGISRDTDSSYRELHSHEFSEIVVVVEGYGEHVIGDSTYPVQKGSVFVVHGDMVHGYRNGVGLVVENIIFSPNRLLLPLEYLGLIPGYHALFNVEPRLRRPILQNGYLILDSSRLQRALDINELIRDEIHGKAVGYEAATQGHFLQLVLMLSRACSFDHISYNQAAYKLAEVLTHIEHHYSQSLSTKDLARIAHLSICHFIRVFNDATGLPPLEYLVRLRIKKAARYLSETDRPVSEISASVGFASSSHFSRQFKRIMGVSPREYRNKAGCCSLHP